MTRFLREDDICNVHYTYEKGRPKIQTIESFHAELFALGFIRIHDPIISQRSRPTGYELNALLIRTLRSVNIMESVKLTESFLKIGENNANALRNIMEMHLSCKDRTLDCLCPLRSVKLLALERSIQHQRSKYPGDDVDIRSKCHLFSMLSRVSELGTVQSKRNEIYRNLLQEANDIEAPLHSTDFTQVNAIFKSLFEKWDTFKSNIERDWRNVRLNNETVSMQANIKHYFKESGNLVPTDQALLESKKLIDACQHRLNLLDSDNRTNKIEEMMLTARNIIKDRLVSFKRVTSISLKKTEEKLDGKSERYLKIIDLISNKTHNLFFDYDYTVSIRC